MVGEFVSVYLHSVRRAVYIASDGGRVCRPLLVVENGRTRLTKTHLDQMALGVLSLQGARGRVRVCGRRLESLGRAKDYPHHSRNGRSLVFQ